MDAKLTPDQAIGVLKWIRIQCDSQLKKEIDRIVKYIESLDADAELGRTARNTQLCYWEYTVDDGDCHGEKCIRYQLCRLCAGKGGE